MAVIQDLPAELIHRILDLVEASDRQDLLRTALVCRDWTPSSQVLLPRDLYCYTASDIHSVAKHLMRVKSARIDHPELRLDSLQKAEDLEFARDLLGAAKRLRSLTLFDIERGFDAATILTHELMASRSDSRSQSFEQIGLTAITLRRSRGACP